MATQADEKAEPTTRGVTGHATRGTEMKQGCKAYAVELSAYFDGELGGAKAERIEAHLADCAGCRDTLERLGKLRNALHALAKPPRRQRSVLDALQARLAEEGADHDDDETPLEKPLC